MTQMIEITNLGEFMAAVGKSFAGMDAALSVALAEAGRPVLMRAQELSPSRRVAESGRLEVHGTEGQIIFEKDWAEASEWSRKPGWMAHGDPGRYGHKALHELSAVVDKIVDQHMEAVITMQGWFN